MSTNKICGIGIHTRPSIPFFKKAIIMFSSIGAGSITYTLQTKFTVYSMSLNLKMFTKQCILRSILACSFALKIPRLLCKQFGLN